MGFVNRFGKLHGHKDAEKYDKAAGKAMGGSSASGEVKDHIKNRFASRKNNQRGENYDTERFTSQGNDSSREGRYDQVNYGQGNQRLGNYSQGNYNQGNYGQDKYEDALDQIKHSDRYGDVGANYRTQGGDGAATSDTSGMGIKSSSGKKQNRMSGSRNGISNTNSYEYGNAAGNTSLEYGNNDVEYRNNDVEYRNSGLEYRSTDADYRNAGPDYTNVGIPEMAGANTNLGGNGNSGLEYKNFPLSGRQAVDQTKIDKKNKRAGITGAVVGSGMTTGEANEINSGMSTGMSRSRENDSRYSMRGAEYGSQGGKYDTPRGNGGFSNGKNHGNYEMDGNYGTQSNYGHGMASGGKGNGVPREFLNFTTGNDRLDRKISNLPSDARERARQAFQRGYQDGMRSHK